uniref:Nonstructural protein 9 n=1 Tax=Alphacoronavirus sp. TaxID=1906673 RepID=A0A8F0ZU95_9ALPC|nr:nonstructural protein 9 [Alphacoronavirus sp.]QWN56321.1 nonstructural protein 9 [Alphacoronavirus sp.]
MRFTTPSKRDQLNMNIFIVMFLLFIAGCTLDLCRYLFYAICWLILGWPSEEVFKILDANFAFSIFCILLFVLLPVCCPLVEEVLLDILDMIVGQLYITSFYRQLF